MCRAGGWKGGRGQGERTRDRRWNFLGHTMLTKGCASVGKSMFLKICVAPVGCNRVECRILLSPSYDGCVLANMNRCGPRVQLLYMFGPSVAAKRSVYKTSRTLEVILYSPLEATTRRVCARCILKANGRADNSTVVTHHSTGIHLTAAG